MTLREIRCSFGSQCSAAAIVLPMLVLFSCLITGVLISPQPAYAYTHWFKMYDINMNEFDSRSEIDANELQQGFCLEVMYDGSDGVGLGWPLAYLNIFVDEARNGKTADNLITYMGGGPIDSEPVIGDTSEVTLLKVYDDDRIYDGKDQYGNPKLATNGQIKDGAQVFTGVIHRLYRVKFLKSISPDTDLEFQFSLIGYSHGIITRNQEGIVRYSIAVQGSAAEDEKEGAGEGVGSSTPRPNESSESQSEANGGDAESADPNGAQSEDGGDAESIDQSGAQSEEQSKGKNESASVGNDSSAQAESSRLSSDRSEGSATDKSANTPKSGNGIKAPGAMAEVGDDASDDGDGVTGVQKAKREEAGVATSALSSAERGQTSAQDAPDKESSVLLELRQTDLGLSDSNSAAAVAQVKLTGIPYLYLLLIALLVSMVPLGGLIRPFYQRLAVRSRLLSD